jgi:hypothetical protein
MIDVAINTKNKIYAYRVDAGTDWRRLPPAKAAPRARARVFHDSENESPMKAPGPLANTSALHIQVPSVKRKRPI